jgi:hypothetical protein
MGFALSCALPVLPIALGMLGLRVVVGMPAIPSDWNLNNEIKN